MAGKYIIIRNDNGMECAITFSEAISHREVAHGREVVSAGFFYLNFDSESYRFNASPYGTSTSLGIGSREEDRIYLEFIFND